MKTKQVVKYFGTKMAVAEVLGINRSAVTRWGDIVPINQAWKIERITGGKVPFVINDYRLRALKD